MVNCEECMNFAYDEEYEEYLCGMDMDEDERLRLLRETKTRHKGCPYYRYYNEYKSVQKQN